MKKILISLVAFWLVCYALLFVINGVVFQPGSTAGGEMQNRANVGISEASAVRMVSSNTTALASAPEQHDLASFFLQPILPASMVTVFGGLAVACGYRLVGLGYRGHPTPQK